MRELHLFAGVGGGILGGMLLGHRCVGAVEIDQYCQKVLRARQADGVFPAFPIHDDVRTFDARPLRGQVDVVCGGYPCQPWSSAGKRLGTADPRHLWPEFARIVSECRPAFVFAENVSMAAFREPWRDLRGLGYRVPPALCLSARDLGAPFWRKRWWLLAADAGGGGLQGCAVSQGSGAEGTRARCATHSGTEDGDADRSRLAQQAGERGYARAELAPAFGATWRAATPRLRRLVSGAARGMDSRRYRITAVGNAQVPMVAATAFGILMQRL